jgi:hypothetical protein
MEQRLRKSLRFPPKNQPIALLKTALPQTPLGLCGEKPKPRPLTRFASERIKGIPKSHITFLPIIHARPAERLFIQRKSQWPDEMQTRSDCQAKPSHIPRIGWNFGFNENNVQRGIHSIERGFDHRGHRVHRGKSREAESILPSISVLSVSSVVNLIAADFVPHGTLDRLLRRTASKFLWL